MEEQDRLLKFKKDMEKLGLAPVKSEEYISPLNDTIMKVKGVANPSISTKSVVKGATEVIDTKPVQKLLSGSQFADKIQSILKSRAAAKTAKNALKSVPILGTAMGIGSALMSGDVAAATQSALPLVGDSSDLGADSASLEGKLENGTITPDEMQMLLNRSK